MIVGAIDTLHKWQQGEVPPPEEVQLYPTKRCNLKCVFCVSATDFYDSQEDIPDERWLELAKELCEMGVKRVLISGGSGEPLVSSATLPMMRIFKKNGVCGRMITNGTLWTDDAVREAVNMRWDQLTFSIDGHNAKIHDSLRGVPGAFDRAVSAIVAFTALKDEAGSDVPRIEINCVLNRENYTHVKEMVRFAAELGVSKLHLEPVCMNSPGAEKLRLDAEMNVELQNTHFPEAVQEAKRLGLETNIGGLIKSGKVSHAGEMRDVILEKVDDAGNTGRTNTANQFAGLACYEPWLWPKIEANGDVWPCSTVPMKENVSARSFSEVWNGKVFQEFRKQILEGKLPESCQNCVVSHLHLNCELRGKLESFKGGEPDEH